MVTNVDVFGAKEVRQLLKVKNRAAEEGVAEAMSQAGLFMEGKVKESIAGQSDEAASVDTGRFLNSISEEHTNKQATVSTNIPYAPFLEDGTLRIAARGHFKNSLSRNKKKITAFVVDKVKKRVEGRII